MGKILKRDDYFETLSLPDQLSIKTTADIDQPLDDKIVRKETRAAVKSSEEVIAKARQEADRIREEARELYQRVEELARQAREEGFEEGKKEGLNEVSELLVKAAHQRDLMFQNMEKDAVNLVYDIAEKIIGQELKERETAIIGLIRQALGASMGQKVLIIVNPVDLEVVRKHQPLLVQSIEVSKSLQIRADEKVAPKGCLIETEIGTIDAQLETQLELIRKTLGVGEEGGGGEI